MKINVIVDEANRLDGYTNIKLEDIDKLDEIVENGEAEEVMLNESIGYFPLGKAMGYINIILGKVRHGGKFIIRDVDAYEVAERFLNFQIIQLP